MPSAAEMLLSVFDRVYIINLAHREDRRREMEAELNRIGLSLSHPAVTLFPASFPPDQGDFPSRGARGCFESQLGVHRAILADGAAHALMLEDDADFAPDFTPLLAAMLPALRETRWDMLYSVSPLEARPGDQPVGAHLLRLSADHTFPLAHFVGFSRRFSERAVPYLEAMQARAIGDPAGGPMHVDGAYCWLRADQPDLVVLGSRQPLAVQRSSRSDIADLRFWDRLPVLRQITAAARRSPPVLALLHRLRRR
ncbi:glycosyltransferase family 25 protein [Paracoccus spongiarum]|uniref:Glycosyltransferase family 25 protein n=1 Tax=Paracoccus spongiarum TaxID=3064387 RepID=A0ABT9JC07_9RHOB|nr:glycosyltransferase family 25 protein [Paracoccus sp. 2205BS29-5]MDP5307343.1 glycosyltransferase family 25 protein [Paracoccus sp. 2205BS29-5]